MRCTVRRVPKRAHVQAANTDNSNVSRILPLTTFRTIDLGGGKNSDPLFSRFYAENESFSRCIFCTKICASDQGSESRSNGQQSKVVGASVLDAAIGMTNALISARPSYWIIGVVFKLDCRFRT